MYALTYFRPASLDEAIAFLEANPEAKPLSGGMTLVPTLKQRLAAPSHLVDLTRLPELQGITYDASVLRIGAATRHAQVAGSDVVRREIPALAALAGLIADPQVRNRGTIGGSVANNDPAADYPAALLGLGATVVTSSRRIAAEDFIVGMFETALQESELVTAIEFPRPERAAYLKYAHAASGYAVTGVFVSQLGGDVRVGVTGAGPAAFRWHDAEQALAEDFSDAALAGLSIDPDLMLDDATAPARYRANLVKVFTRRALAAVLKGA
ncbi:FAD binding domain-containing protein [Massilia soli]|uniref:Xanthine dehydrogenase family protein subunit M n=1 Tax=Massilia soli TaxID=2792854 RepID=A0ABS7STA4_9BURK|nr:xanthine dehydrogenase family protein subunit M [Massilia soli]